MTSSKTIQAQKLLNEFSDYIAELADELEEVREELRLIKNRI